MVLYVRPRRKGWRFFIKKGCFYGEIYEYTKFPLGVFFSVCCCFIDNRLVSDMINIDKLIKMDQKGGLEYVC